LILSELDLDVFCVQFFLFFLLFDLLIITEIAFANM